MIQCYNLHLKTVTPLFLGGADPRGAPELRAASVRGALRYWLRALLGGVIGDQSLDELRRAEAAVFGSTAAASPVVVRIQPESAETIPFSRLADWDNNQGSPRKQGIAYLFFAARRTRQEAERSAICADSRFGLTLVMRPGAGSPGQHALKQAYAALWLLTHLGGLGSRSRRGAGSVQVIFSEAIDGNMPALAIRAESPRQLSGELAEGLKQIREVARELHHSSQVAKPSAFDVLHPHVCKILVIDRPFDSWVDALDAVGQALQRFRRRREPDYSNVKRAIRGNSLDEPVKRAAFGLPIVFYYRSLGGQRGTLQGTQHDRRASPLLIRVTRLANNQYAVVLTLFYSELLPSTERLLLKRVRQERQARQQSERDYEDCVTTSVPSLNLIEEFLRDLGKRVAPLLEVTGW